MSRSNSGGGDRGATLAEAAFILPLLLLLTFGIWTTARAWNVDNTLSHAAREAARFGATVDPWVSGTSEGEVEAVSNSDLATSNIDSSAVNTCVELVPDGSQPSCDSSHTNSTGTDQVFVKLSYPNYSLNFLFFAFDIGLEGTAISRFEGSP